jgi:uncharacterized protein YkwD
MALSTAAIALTAGLGGPAIAQDAKTPFDTFADRLAKAEQDLNDKKARCLPIDMAPYQALVRETEKRSKAVWKAKASGVPVGDAEAIFKQETAAKELANRAQKVADEAAKCPPPAQVAKPVEDQPTKVEQPAVWGKGTPAVTPTAQAQSTVTFSFGNAQRLYAAAKARCDAGGMLAARAQMDMAMALQRQAIEAAVKAGDTAGAERLKAELKSMEAEASATLSMNQCTSPILDPASAQMLALQNKARAEVGSPPLQWDPELAQAATSYAAQLASGVPYVHSSRAGREKVRENPSMGRPGETASQMIQVWLNEKRNFIAGIFPNVSRTGNWYDVGHYSQMIWSITTRVGCGTGKGAKFEYLVCRYSPPGNADGKPVLAYTNISDEPAVQPGEQPQLIGEPAPTKPPSDSLAALNTLEDDFWRAMTRFGAAKARNNVAGMAMARGEMDAALVRISAIGTAASTVKILRQLRLEMDPTKAVETDVAPADAQGKAAFGSNNKSADLEDLDNDFWDAINRFGAAKTRNDVAGMTMARAEMDALLVKIGAIEKSILGGKSSETEFMERLRDSVDPREYGDKLKATEPLPDPL